MQFRFGRTLDAPIRGDRYPDFWTAESAGRIGIEVVEVVNREHIAAGGYGVPQSVAVNVARRLLLDTIQSKIAKLYPRPTDWKLWLLAYDATHALVGAQLQAAQLAYEALGSMEQPFTEIWLMTPTPHREFSSFLESVWPSTQFSSTEVRK